ncbi:MAG: Crp/Fnr family transcriptional regulator [Asticcacaulis sp.]
MSTATRSQLDQNALLNVLLEHDIRRLEPHMLALDMAAGAVLIHSGQEVTDTWFPCGAAMAAFCISSPEGHTVDVGYVGREGAVGGIVSNGHVPAFSTAVVRMPGLFLRIKTIALEQAKLDSLALRHWFSRYSDCLLAQVFQTAACNATHTIRQRVAKLLLAGLERTDEMAIAMTQEQLADMLGVGRTFISRVISGMRDEGIIETQRGRIVVLSVPSLRHQSCRCTDIIQNHFDAVLHGIYPLPG